MSDNEPDSPALEESGPRGKTAVVWLCKVLLGLLFIVSGLSKGLSVARTDAGMRVSKSPVFELMLIKQGMVKERSHAAAATRFLMVLELSLGLLLLQRAHQKRIVLPATLAVLGGFTIYLAYLMVFRQDIKDCGCFGDLIALSPGLSIIKNVVMMAMAGGLLKWESPPSKNGWVAAAATVSLVVLTVIVAFPQRALPTTAENGNNTTPSSPFDRFQDLTVGDTQVDVTKGTYLLCFFSLDCEHCLDTARQIADDLDGWEPANVLFLFLGEPSQTDAFFTDIDAEYPYAIPDPNDFFDFIGSAPPRVYLIRDGVEVTHQDKFELEAMKNALNQLAD